MKKQKKAQKNKSVSKKQNKTENIKNIKNIKKTSQNSNFILARLKAFITDMFLLNMPILYTTTYVFLQGKDDFLHNQVAIFSCEMLYCFILFLFFALKGQTPGFRYAEIMLCKDYDDSIPSFLQTFIFIFVWLIELSFFLWIFTFFRKDKRTLHEVLSKTHVIYKENPARRQHAK